MTDQNPGFQPPEQVPATPSELAAPQPPTAAPEPVQLAPADYIAPAAYTPPTAYTPQAPIQGYTPQAPTQEPVPQQPAQSYAPPAQGYTQQPPQGYTPPQQPQVPTADYAQQAPQQGYVPQQPPQGYDPNAYAQSGYVPAQPTDPNYPQQYGQPQPVAQPAGEEQVGKGLLFSLGGVVAGVVLTVVIWQAGFIASICGFVLAAGAVWLYSIGAKSSPRKGMVPLIGVIVVGVLISIVACLVSELLPLQAEAAEYGYDISLPDLFQLILQEDPGAMASFGGSAAMLFLFAALGMFGTLRRLATNR